MNFDLRGIFVPPAQKTGEVGSLCASPLLAFCVLAGIPILYGASQEILAIPGGHDDYYFLMRSESFTLFGHYLVSVQKR